MLIESKDSRRNRRIEFDILELYDCSVALLLYHLHLGHHLLTPADVENDLLKHLPHVLALWHKCSDILLRLGGESSVEVL